MRSRGEILRAHYVRVLRKASTWAGLIALTSTMFVSVPANAWSQITSRSATMGSAVPSAVTTYTFTWTTPSSEPTATQVVSFSLCTSPLQGSCTGATGASLSGAALNTGAPTSAPFTSTWALGTGATTCPVATASTICIYKLAGSALSASTSYTVQFTTVTNPSITGQFYAQLSTYANANPQANILDFGGFALDTTQTMSVTANVQEALTFCVGNTSNSSCGSIGGATVAMNTSGSTANPLSTAVTSYGNAYMDVFTNGSGGYTVAYTGTALTAASGTIASAASGGTAVGSGGAEEFGFNIVNNATFGSLSSIGAAPTNTPTSTTSGYGTANTVAYTTTANTTLFTMTGANSLVNDLLTLSYAANIAATTKAGSYTATQSFLATATF
jgi:hypothetical protein